MIDNLFTYPEGKTTYQITNEDGDKTTITLEKWVADILQIEFEDVHHKIQAAYDSVLQSKSHLGRRQRGDYIRLMAENTANKYQKTKKKLLGWNDEEILSLL